MISASRAWFLALSTSWRTPRPRSMRESLSDFSIEIVPTRTGWPAACRSLMSSTTASNVPASNVPASRERARQAGQRPAGLVDRHVVHDDFRIEEADDQRRRVVQGSRDRSVILRRHLERELPQSLRERNDLAAEFGL